MRGKDLGSRTKSTLSLSWPRQKYQVNMKFKDRASAGARLAAYLEPYANTGAVVFAIPNGGIPVGIQIANALNARLELMITRRINFPFTTESGFGAITADGHAIIDDRLATQHGITKSEIDRMKQEALNRIDEKLTLFGVQRQAPDVTCKVVIICDDGIAGGFSMRASIASIAGMRPSMIIVAVPTAPSSSLEKIKPLVHEIVCPIIGRGYSFAVADAYEHWYDISDSEAKMLWNNFAPYRIMGSENENQ